MRPATSRKRSSSGEPPAAAVRACLTICEKACLELWGRLDLAHKMGELAAAIKAHSHAGDAPQERSSGGATKKKRERSVVALRDKLLPVLVFCDLVVPSS